MSNHITVRDSVGATPSSCAGQGSGGGAASTTRAGQGRGGGAASTSRAGQGSGGGAASTVDATPSSRQCAKRSGGGAASTRGLCALALALGCAFPSFGASSEAAPAVAPSYDAAGLRSLQVNGIELLASGAVRVTSVRLADAYRNPYELADPYVKDDRAFAEGSVEVREAGFDAAEKRLTQRFDWGAVAVGYRSGDGAFDIEIEVQNRSPQIIERIGLEVLALKLPEGAGVDKGGHNLGAPVLAALSPPVRHYRRVSFPAAVDQGVAELLGPTAAETEPEAPADVRTLCPECYPKATAAHLMETRKAAVALGTVTAGRCAACGAETRLPDAPRVVAGTPQADRPLALEWQPAGPGVVRLAVASGSAPAAEVYDGVWNVRPIKPGAAETIRVGLRFGPADRPAPQVASAFVQAFSEAHPFMLRWPDRRPIAMAQLAAETDWGKGNPRGWWGLRDNGANIDTPEGRAIFDKWILGYADQLIAVSEKAGSQGVIVWDLEGKQYPGCVYYGDPRIMKHTAPEMEAMADAFFKRLTDAGLRVGMCIRPHQIYPVAVPRDEIEKYRGTYPNMFIDLPYTESWEGFNLKSFALEFWPRDEVRLGVNTPLDSIHRSPVERLEALILYCKRRWGATLFYIDTNHFKRARAKSRPNAAGGYDGLDGWGSLLMGAAQWEELCRRHPDCLLIPEHEYAQYWASTAPYRQPPHDGATPELVSALYPEAFAAIAMNGDAETHIRKDVASYTAAVRRGDLLMHHGWYGPSPVVTNVYTAAAQSAPLRVALLADGTFRLADQAITDLAGLKQAVAAQVKGKPFAARRVFVEYAPAAGRPARAALIAALEQAEAIIVWAQPLEAGK